MGRHRISTDDEQSVAQTRRNINDNNAEAAEMATQRTRGDESDKEVSMDVGTSDH